MDHPAPRGEEEHKLMLIQAAKCDLDVSGRGKKHNRPACTRRKKSRQRTAARLPPTATRAKKREWNSALPGRQITGGNT